MNRILNQNRYLISFGIPLALLGVLILLIKSLFPSGNSTLTFAITFDFLITVPIVYFLLIGKTSIPKITVIPFLILGLILGTYFLPKDSQTFLSLFKTWALPVIELSVLTYITIKVRSAIKKHKNLKATIPDFFSALKISCEQLLPKQAVILVVTEIAVFYYGFIYWKKRPLKENEFTYHKDSGTIALLIAIIVIVGIETYVLHVLLLKWNSIAAWALTFLSLYSAIQVFGFLKSIIKRPISIDAHNLNLRYGIMSESTIDLRAIKAIELSSKDLEFNKETRKLSPLGALESHNVIIQLHTEQRLIGLYGIERTFKTLALYVDHKEKFMEKIENALQQDA